MWFNFRNKQPIDSLPLRGRKKLCKFLKFFHYKSGKFQEGKSVIMTGPIAHVFEGVWQATP
jgi:hypothetical protein